MHIYLQIAQRAIGPDAAVYRTDVSVLRPCYNEESLLGWKNAAQKYPDMLEAISSEDFKGKLEVNLNNEDEAIFSPSPSLSALPVAVGAMSMSNVYVVDAPVYMLGLWKAIQEMSTDSNCKVEWVSKNVDDLDVLLADSDAVVLCSGAGSQKLWSNADPESAKLPFNYVRGQNLIYDGKDLPEIAVLSGEYVVPIQDKLVCGATHEFGQLEDLLIQGPDLEKAESLLGDKASSLFPQLQSRSPISANTGIRVSSQRTQLGRLPIISRNRLNSKVWMFTGLGSRGLIHHAVVGKYLANAVIKKDEGVIPSEFVRNL
jgi:glycine/D-amino acid oxidase-like deaminating enzyme